METKIDYCNNFTHVNTWKVRGNLIIDFQLRNMIGEVQEQIHSFIYFHSVDPYKVKQPLGYRTCHKIGYKYENTNAVERMILVV